MRFSRVILAAVPVAALVACADGSEVTNTVRPPLMGVRYVNAVGDTGRVDIRMIDQLEYSANTIDSIGGIRYRQGTRYFPTQVLAAGRKIRVFGYQQRADGTVDGSPANVANIMLDTVITGVNASTPFQAGKNYTFLLVGSARAARTDAGRMRFVVIEDTPPAEAAGNIHVRVVNANTGAPIDAFFVATATTAPAGTPAFANVANRAVSAYVARPVATAAATTFAVAATNTGTLTALGTSAVAAFGTAGTSGTNPIAGAGQAGTAFSAFVFAPAATAGGVRTGMPAAVNTAFNSVGAELLVDRLPASTVR